MQTPNTDRGNAIEVVNITKIFGSGEDKVFALDDVSLNIKQNEFFTLLGPSGCGKTTLLRLIAGFDHPSSGRILLHGEDISSWPPFKRPINTVFQNYALFPHLTVAQNISFGLENMGHSKAQINDTVSQMLALVQMDAMKNRRIAQLSGGQQQRVALARALAPHPKVLLLDEPLSALDFKLRKEMQLELKRLQHETGITFIFVTHDQEEALTMSDNIAVVNQGTIRQIGTPDEIYDKPAERFVADFIGDTNFLSGKVMTAHNGSAQIKLTTGQQISAQCNDSLNEHDEVYLAIRPEHAELVKYSNQSDLSGKLENIVYFGTDTHYHILIDETERFIIRQQNRPNQSVDFDIGEQVGIDLVNNATRVLKD